MSAATEPSAAHLRVEDAVELPKGEAVVHATATRTDRYTIHVTRSTASLIEVLAEMTCGTPLSIVTDQTVDGLHGEQLRAGLRAGGISYKARAVPPGERSKSRAEAKRLIDWLAESSLGRLDYVVPFGGGVINDLGGYVAAKYMRSVPYINLPTTLLAQVDGAMGGKVAVNHPTAKNLIGAFHQPKGVISNVAFLESLDRRDLAAGLAESIKKAIIASPPYWEFIEGNAEAIMGGDLDALEVLVRAAAKIKTILVERDPYEEDLRRPLNFGHTVGHPLETITGYGPLRHGEAVAFGMVVESRIAANRGLLAAADLERIVALLDRVGLPTSVSALPVPVDTAAMVAAMDKVRLIRAGSLRYVLPIQFGKTEIADDVTTEELHLALRECGATFARRVPRRRRSRSAARALLSRLRSRCCGVLGCVVRRGGSSRSPSWAVRRRSR